MKLVASKVPPGLIEWRHRIGADGHDEMWEGVLHMNPVPSGKHQDLVIELVTWLRAHWARPNGGRAFNERNVAAPNGWPNDYRVPDIVLLAPERLELDKDTHIDGGPTVAVEIRSPDDESYAKLPFYHRIGVAEVWIIDRDTKAVEISMLDNQSQGYITQSATRDGWLRSGVTPIEFRAIGDDKLGIRIAGEPTTHRVLPEA